MSQGLGQIERKILYCLDAEGGYVNTIRLASMVYGRKPTTANITYTLYALGLLAKDGRVHGVKGRPYIWTTDASVLGRRAREQRIRQRKNAENRKRNPRLKYKSKGRPTHRDELPGQLNFWDDWSASYAKQWSLRPKPFAVHQCGR